MMMPMPSGTNRNVAASANPPLVSTLTHPAITNLINKLAINPAEAYPLRPLSRINQIIIHHSAISRLIGSERLAKIHVAQGKLGLGYHFFITNEGQIFQTNELTTISAHTPNYDQNSIAICFAGNFTRKIPSTTQIQAGQTLLQILIQQFNIPLQQIKGANELIAIQSPGKQWLTGRQWKNRLLRGLAQPNIGLALPDTGEITSSLTRLPQTSASASSNIRAQSEALTTQSAQIQQQNHQASQLKKQTTQLDQTKKGDGTAVVNQRVRRLEAALHQAQTQIAQVAVQDAAKEKQLTALNTHIAELTAQLAQAQSIRQKAENRVQALNSELRQIRSDSPSTDAAIAFAMPSAQVVFQSPTITAMMNQLPHQQGMRYPTRDAQIIDTLIIHHTAVAASVGIARLAKLQLTQGKQGFIYHYLVKADGEIVQAHEVNTITQHTAAYDQTSLAIAFAGNFTDATPTPAQVKAGASLVSYLQQQFDIPQEKIYGASELAETQSPGKQWLAGKRWKDDLLKALS